MTLAEKKLQLIKAISEMDDENTLNQLGVLIIHKSEPNEERTENLPSLEGYTIEIEAKTDIAELANVQLYDPLALKDFQGFWELEDNEEESLKDLLADLTP